MMNQIINIPSNFFDAPDRLSVGLIEVLMCWPHDDKYRSDVFEVISIKDHITRYAIQLKRNQEEMEKFTDELNRLPTESEFRKKGKTAFVHGVIAGAIALDAIGQAKIGEKSEVYLKAVKARFSEMIPGFHTSEKTIDNRIWKNYRRVAHFWAAYLYLFAEENIKERVFPCSPNELYMFIAVAEAFRIEGESLRIRQSREKFLFRKDESIRLPPMIPFPPVTLNFELRPKASTDS